MKKMTKEEKQLDDIIGIYNVIRRASDRTMNNRAFWLNLSHDVAQIKKRAVSKTVLSDCNKLSHLINMALTHLK